MHEVALAEGIRRIVDAQAAAHGFSRVTRLRLEIGRFAAVEPAALTFALRAVLRGGPAEGAAVDMIDLPGRALCCDCGAEVELADRLDPCPLCGGTGLLPRGGDDLRVKDMEVL